MATQTTNLGLTKPAYSDVADIMVINNNMDVLDSRTVFLDDNGEVSNDIIYSHKDAALTIKNHSDVYSQLINSGTQYINFVDTNDQNTAIISKERTSGNNGDNTLSILLRGLNGNYYGMTIHDNGLAQRITGVTPTVSGLDDETIPTMAYLNSSKATKLVHIDRVETITGEKTFDSLSANYNLKLIENGTDINTLIPNVAQSNIYCCNTDETARTLVNCPTVIGFIMESSAIYSDGSDKSVIQKITDRDGYTYTRTAITGAWSDWQNLIKTPVTSAPSQSVVNKAYVESTDGVTNNLVHRTGLEIIKGNKEFESFSQCPHNLVRVAGTGYRKIYTGTLEFNHHNLVLMVMCRRIGWGMGILAMGGHNGTEPHNNWLCGTIIEGHKHDFVITYESKSQLATVWQLCTGTTDGFCTQILAHSWNGNCETNPWHVSTDNTVYVISETGYTDLDGNEHIFKYYVVSE